MDGQKHHIKLKRSDGTWHVHTIEDFSGTVQDFGLVVLAGQTVFVEADVFGDQLTNFLAVDHIEKPEKTIVASFMQQNDGGMFLNLTQPFKRDVKFDLEILRLEKKHFSATSSLPVRAGHGTTEMWPEPISMVVLRNARLIDWSTEKVNATYQGEFKQYKQKIIAFFVEELKIAKGSIKLNWFTVLALVVFINMVVQFVSQK